jgi:antitoxin MazE
MEPVMKVAKWGNSLAVRLPADVVEALGLEAGDEIEIGAMKSNGVDLVRPLTREQLLESLRQFRGMMPAGYKFDRDEAHER